MKTITNYVIGAFLLIMIVDFLGFMMWVITDQKPGSRVYVGVISAHLFKWQDDVGERAGILYYPDGAPVRNYEQLELYYQGME